MPGRTSQLMIVAGLLASAALACNIPGAQAPQAPTPSAGAPAPQAIASSPTSTPTSTTAPTETPTQTATLTPTIIATHKPTVVPSSTPASLSACRLYTRAEVEALYGEPAIVKSSGPGPTHEGVTPVYCVYATTSGYYVSISVTPYADVSAAGAAFQQSKAQFGLTQSVPLGDEAGMQPGVALVGTVLIARQGLYLVSVSLVSGGNSSGATAAPLDPVTEASRAQTIMGAILSRLP